MLSLLRNNAVADPEKLLLELIDEQQAKLDDFLKRGNLKKPSESGEPSLKPNKVSQMANTQTLHFTFSSDPIKTRSTFSETPEDNL